MSQAATRIVLEVLAGVVPQVWLERRLAARKAAGANPQ